MTDQSKNYAWISNCPVCNQGRLMVAKETESNKLFIVCEECESEWSSPEDVKEEKPAKRDLFGASTFLTREELADSPWVEFLHS